MAIHPESRIIRSKHCRLLAVVPALAVQATILIFLPFLANSSESIPRPMWTSPLSGHQYIQELLKSHPNQIQEVLRMKLEVFQFLYIELKTKGLKDSRYGITIEEQVAMFLFTVAWSASNRDVQEWFQHSGETVLWYFHDVLKTINRLVPKYIKLLTSSDPNVSIVITSNAKFYPFFSNCVSALDGTHIHAKVPQAQAAAFRNHKGFLSQNVLACCEFDTLTFTYYILQVACWPLDMFLQVEKAHYMTEQFWKLLLTQGLRCQQGNTIWEMLDLVWHHGVSRLIESLFFPARMAFNR